MLGGALWVPSHRLTFWTGGGAAGYTLTAESGSFTITGIATAPAVAAIVLPCSTSFAYPATTSVPSVADTVVPASNYAAYPATETDPSVQSMSVPAAPPPVQNVRRLDSMGSRSAKVRMLADAGK